jgi:hypothetical protein
MNAYAKKEFPGTFLLDEERLTKLSDIIHTRHAGKYPGDQVLFKVFRSDNFVFEAPSYGDVMREENGATNSIRKIEIGIRHDSLRLTLAFDDVRGVSLDIEGEDRDFVFLLYSDIKTYIDAEIIKPRRFVLEKETYEVCGYIIMALGFLYFGLTYVIPSQAKPPDSVLASLDIHEKLNYILMRTTKTRFDYRVILACLVVGSLFSYIPSQVLSRFPRSNIFYLGKNIAAYDKYVATVGKVSWGVGIAFAVSFAASIVAWLFTKA